MSLKPVCALIERRDGQAARLTNLDADVEVTASGYEGTYEAAGGVSITAIKNNSSMATDNAEISGAVTTGWHLPVTPADIEGGLWDMARVTIFELNPATPSSVRVLLKGPIGKIRRTFEGEYVAEARNLFQLVQQRIGETITLTCRAVLGSGSETPVIRRCGVNLAAFAVAGTITSIYRDQYTFDDSALESGSPSYAAGWFRDGVVTWLTGNNAGRQYQIRRHLNGGRIVLDLPTPYSMQVGDAYSMTPGCSKEMVWDKATKTATGDCKDKFGNLPNMRANGLLPGMDKIIFDMRPDLVK